MKSWGRPRLQGGRRKTREGTQGGPHGRSGGGRKAEPEAPGPSRTAMAHLDPAAHHRAHGYAPPPVLPLSSAAFSSPSHFIPKPKPTFPFGNVNLMSRKGLVARGTELAGRRRRRGRAGEEPARGHVTAAGPVGGNQSVGILEGITKNGRRQTRERPYRKHKCPPETERQREVKLWTVKLQWPVDLSSGSIGFFRCG